MIKLMFVKFHSGEDLKGFKPNMYRLMQRSQTPLRIGLMYNHVFEQERNKVQFIADWPTGNDASIISSLQACLKQSSKFKAAVLEFEPFLCSMLPLRKRETSGSVIVVLNCVHSTDIYQGLIYRDKIG